MSRDLYVVTQRCVDTFKKAGVPLTDDQTMVPAGVLGVEIEKAGREGMAMGEAMATRKRAQRDAPTNAELSDLWDSVANQSKNVLVFARALLARYAPAHDAEEDAYVIDRMSKLLAGVAVALKGPEKARHRHGYQDLPELAAQVMAELQKLRQDAERERDAAYLQEADQHALHRFIETTEDDEGYDIGKDRIKRLAELGVVSSHGFGRYGVTAFGYWVHEHYWHQNPSLPLMTNSDRDAAARAQRAAVHGERDA